MSEPLSPAGLPPATGGSMLSAAGSLERGQPSSILISLGVSTPACRAPTRPTSFGIDTQQIAKVDDQPILARKHGLGEAALNLLDPR
jgi:hypothetical protein